MIFAFTVPMFGGLHLLALSVEAVLIAAVFLFGCKIKKNSKLDKGLRYGTAAYLLATELWFRISKIVTNGFQVSNLPLDLCAICLWLTVILLVTGSEKLFKIYFCWAVTGALLSFIVVDIGSDVGVLRYINYFSSHGLFLVGVIYFFITRKVKISLYEHLISTAVLIVLAVALGLLNIPLKTNFMFLREYPQEVAFLFMWAAPVDFLIFGFCIFIMNSIWYALTVLWNVFKLKTPFKAMFLDKKVFSSSRTRVEQAEKSEN